MKHVNFYKACDLLSDELQYCLEIKLIPLLASVEQVLMEAVHMKDFLCEVSKNWSLASKN